MVARGPIAALICYIHDHGWDTTHYDRWTLPGHNGEDEFQLNMHFSGTSSRKSSTGPKPERESPPCFMRSSAAGLGTMEEICQGGQHQSSDGFTNMASRSTFYQDIGGHRSWPFALPALQLTGHSHASDLAMQRDQCTWSATGSRRSEGVRSGHQPGIRAGLFIAFPQAVQQCRHGDPGQPLMSSPYEPVMQ